ncbi:MAG: bifunctional phosphopantothenoylcysteine decarboxylase/phosphopantothenate--cysteine ligase CoaBC [Bacillota bacterium]
MERKKRVLLGVTGCIAAYKACEIVSTLSKADIEVKVIMTKNACSLVAPKTFEVLSKNAVALDTFEQVANFDVHHISLAAWADVFLVAPATANTIAKFALGIADDMLSTTYLASKAKKIIVPAMNTNMYESVAFQKNLQTIKDHGCEIIQPICGNLACGDVGKGKMQSPAEICKYVIDALKENTKMQGKTVIVTAGGTAEPIDGVRKITNSSSGKMGVEIAKSFEKMGANVIFVHGNTTVEIPNFYQNIKVSTTDQMFDAVMTNLEKADAIVKSAAPCDFKVKNQFTNKIKEKSLALELIPNVDIAFEVGKVKGDKVLVIFAAETQNLLENARGKLAKKNADFVVANDITQEGAGFNVDTNIATLIFADGKEIPLEKMAKSQLASVIAESVKNLLEKADK